MANKYNDDFSDITVLTEEDGKPIELPTNLLCQCLETWARTNLTKSSLSVFYNHLEEKAEDDLDAYEIAAGKALLNEVLLEAITIKSQEVLAEQVAEIEVPPEPVMPENETIKEHELK